jgi:N-acetylglucosamine kinase-like BadF-type ATPase
MKYYLAADGGGTKLNLILYDQNLNVIKTARSGGINEIKKPIEQITEDCQKALNGLFEGTGITEIEEFTYSLASSHGLLKSIVESVCKVKRSVKYNEGQTAIACSGETFGVVAQAGTGSDVFVFQPTLKTVIGGLGSVLGDDGSGFDIGLKSIKSAIRSYENRGEKTLLEKLVFEKFGVNDSRGLIDLAKRKDISEQIASVTYLTSKSAEQGDKVAIDIYKNAGVDMAGQVNFALSLIGKDNLVGSVIVSGGAWKGCKYMYQTFLQQVKNDYPSVQVKFPNFEPVVGCVILRCVSDGQTYGQIEKTLYKNFSNYLFDKGDNL